MKYPFETYENEFLIRSLMSAKEMMAHRDKVNSGKIIPEYILIQQKQSNLSRSQRDTIEWQFNSYKSKGLYSDKDLEKITKLINSTKL